jgi:PhzF family phenazine biosynthesis protein
VRTHEGRREASLTSVVPRHEPAPARLVADALATLHWSAADLDPAIAPARIYAGAWHLVLALRSRAHLDSMTYEFEALKDIMLRDGLTTLQLIWRESPLRYHARDPFPVGGVVEDPATGAAAAALGGYLRDAGLVTAPTTMEIRQGEAMGRPSRIIVDIPSTGGIIVTGTAVALAS